MWGGDSPASHPRLSTQCRHSHGVRGGLCSRGAPGVSRRAEGLCVQGPGFESWCCVCWRGALASLSFCSPFTGCHELITKMTENILEAPASRVLC